MKTVTPEILCQFFDYDPETGLFYWKARVLDWFSAERHWKRWNTRFAGKEAFTATQNYGYKCGRVFNQTFLAHRVAYAMMKGVWPDIGVDHINGDTSDNRWANLRIADHKANAKNSRKSVRNTSGFTGVKRSPSGRWIAQVTVEHRTVHLGTFDTKQQAISARVQANKKYGFHKNHGRHPELAA